MCGLYSDSDGKESACNARDPVSIPGSGRCPGEENSYSLQYSFLENSMDRGAWWATIPGVVKSTYWECVHFLFVLFFWFFFFWVCTFWLVQSLSAAGFPVLHNLLEFVQIHVHWIGDAIQPSHPLSSPSPPAFNLSQHQGLFQWVRSSHQVVKVLQFQLQHYSFQWIFRVDLL